MNIDNYRKAYIEAIYKSKALLIKPQLFTLRSGKASHIYLNHRQFLTQSNYLTLIAEAYTALIQTELSDYTLAVVDSIMSPIIAGAISTITGHDLAVVKTKKLEHGTQEDIYGKMNKPLVIVDDMSSTGGIIIETAQKIRNQGGQVAHCVISACRNNQASSKLQKHGIQMLAIASFGEIISTLKPNLTTQELEIIATEQKELSL